MDFLSSRPAEGGERQKPAAAQQRANLPAATLSLSLQYVPTTTVLIWCVTVRPVPAAAAVVVVVSPPATHNTCAHSMRHGERCNPTRARTEPDLLYSSTWSSQVSSLFSGSRSLTDTRRRDILFDGTWSPTATRRFDQHSSWCLCLVSIWPPTCTWKELEIHHLLSCVRFLTVGSNTHKVYCVHAHQR